MGMFDAIANRLTAGKEDLAGAPKNLVAGALEWIDGEKGGLTALTDKLSQSGLGEQVKSWIGPGANLPISPDQIKHALGPAELDRLALKTKLSVEEVTSHLAAALPQIVDKLTPDGKLAAGSLMDQAQGFLGKLGFGKKES
jgi:uncharacterized protein YidB (DUF937 family)